jgi:GxxExxY protein
LIVIFAALAREPTNQRSSPELRHKYCKGNLKTKYFLFEVKMSENEISKHIVDAALKIHRLFGPGLLESVYEVVLAAELERRGLRVKRQQPIPIIYEDVRLEIGFRADPTVEDKVIIEIKSIDALAPVHYKQVLTYLKIADKRLGLVINFNVELIRDGIKRVVNGLEEVPM